MTLDISYSEVSKCFCIAFAKESRWYSSFVLDISSLLRALALRLQHTC